MESCSCTIALHRTLVNEKGSIATQVLVLQQVSWRYLCVLLGDQPIFTCMCTIMRDRQCSASCMVRYKGSTDSSGQSAGVCTGQGDGTSCAVCKTLSRVSSCSCSCPCACLSCAPRLTLSASHSDRARFSLKTSCIAADQGMQTLTQTKDMQWQSYEV